MEYLNELGVTFRGKLTYYSSDVCSSLAAVAANYSVTKWCYCPPFRENIESLALALAEIASRQAQHRNFQLVVITHDEEFIEQLSRSDKLQHYQKVSRNARGLSEIRKMNVANLEQ